MLDRNWRGRGGELDLVVERVGQVRFVEVKARSDNGLDPLESITASKRSKLVRAASAWLEARVSDSVEEACFMVAIVDLSTEPWGVDLLDDAFDAA